MTKKCIFKCSTPILSKMLNKDITLIHCYLTKLINYCKYPFLEVKHCWLVSIYIVKDLEDSMVYHEIYIKTLYKVPM